MKEQMLCEPITHLYVGKLIQNLKFPSKTPVLLILVQAKVFNTCISFSW